MVIWSLWSCESDQFLPHIWVESWRSIYSCLECLSVKTKPLSSNLEVHLDHGHMIIYSIREPSVLGNDLSRKTSSAQCCHVVIVLVVYIAMEPNLLQCTRWSLTSTRKFMYPLTDLVFNHLDI